MTVIGARPQFIKAAVLSKELDSRACEECLVHTGQHYDYEMSKIFFDQLHIKNPDYSLEVGSGSHASQTGEVMKRLEPVILHEAPAIVLVYGDTNTTLAGALTAAKLRVPIGHVEAGVRSFNRSMPEEINRIVADHVAEFHFAPTRTAAIQLEKEGITEKVHVVGDLMVDLALETALSLPARPAVLQRFELNPQQFGVMTVHRASNTDVVENFSSIIQGIRGLEFPVVFPIHPRTASLALQFKVGRPGDNIIPCSPLSYVDMIALQKFARTVLTDSGGMQKEAFVLQVPCVTLREETEWPETLESGWNALAGTDPDRIYRLGNRATPTVVSTPYFGDGHTARHIADVVLGRSLVAS